jgi:hypothetical protein
MKQSNTRCNGQQHERHSDGASQGIPFHETSFHNVPNWDTDANNYTIVAAGNSSRTKSRSGGKNP